MFRKSEGFLLLPLANTTISRRDGDEATCTDLKEPLCQRTPAVAVLHPIARAAWASQLTPEAEAEHRQQRVCEPTPS